MCHTNDHWLPLFWHGIILTSSRIGMILASFVNFFHRWCAILPPQQSLQSLLITDLCISAVTPRKLNQNTWPKIAVGIKMLSMAPIEHLLHCFTEEARGLYAEEAAIGDPSNCKTTSHRLDQWLKHLPPNHWPNNKYHQAQEDSNFRTTWPSVAWCLLRYDTKQPMNYTMYSKDSITTILRNIDSTSKALLVAKN